MLNPTMIDEARQELDRALTEANAVVSQMRDGHDYARQVGTLTGTLVILIARATTVSKMLAYELDHAACKPGCTGIHYDERCTVIQ